MFTRTPQNPDDPAQEVLEAIAQRAQGHRQAPAGPGARRAQPRLRRRGGAITLTGEPRIQGGPGSSVRVAKLPATLPLRTTRAGDGKGVRIAVLDTGLFNHQWLQRRPGARPAPTTSGTSSTTATPTTSPATARSSPA